MDSSVRSALMAIVNNKLIQKNLSRQEDASDLDRQLSRIEEDVRKLKIDFDIYFNGATKRPPFEARARLEARMKRLADNRSLTYAQRYLYNGLMSTYTSYRELWRRTLRARGEDLI
jgi:hypothetical protein